MNCRWIQNLVAVIIAVLALWPDLIGASASKWVIVIGAVVLLLHGCCCSACGDMKKKR